MSKIDKIIWNTLLASGIISLFQILCIVFYYLIIFFIPINHYFDISVFVNILCGFGLVFTSCLIWFKDIIVPDSIWIINYYSTPLFLNYTIADFINDEYNEFKKYNSSDEFYMCPDVGKIIESYLFSRNQSFIEVLNKRKDFILSYKINEFDILIKESSFFNNNSEFEDSTQISNIRKKLIYKKEPK